MKDIESNLVVTCLLLPCALGLSRMHKPLHSSAHVTVAYTSAASQHAAGRNSNLGMFLVAYLLLALAATILHGNITWYGLQMSKISYEVSTWPQWCKISAYWSNVHNSYKNYHQLKHELNFYLLQTQQFWPVKSKQIFYNIILIEKYVMFHRSQ